MSSSPDKFHSVRENISDIKSKNNSLHLMELKSHLLMLNEYDDQILSHYLDLEKQYKPVPQLIAQQPEIRLKMRYLVIDYLLDIVNKFKLTSETFFTTVQIIDRYSSVRIIKKSQFQLVGLCCLWISSKFHEKKQNVPTLEDLTKLCCNCYSKKLFINMETHILSSIGWCIGTNLESMIDILIQKNKLYNLLDIKLTCLYICQLVQFSKISLNFKNSQITFAALSLSLRALNGYNQQPALNELEISLLKLISKPCPSSMIDQSLHTSIIQLKKFYNTGNNKEHHHHEDLENKQLLTPPGSATGSIDAGIKYIPTTPMYANENNNNSLNIATDIRTNDIYPSPIETVTPPVSKYGMKRNYDSGSTNESIPSFKKVRYDTTNNVEDNDFFYEY